MLARPNPGEHQQLRSVVSSTTQYHLAPGKHRVPCWGSDLTFSVRVRVGTIEVSSLQALHTYRDIFGAVIEKNLCHKGVSLDDQVVWELLSDRADVFSRAVSRMVFGGKWNCEESLPPFFGDFPRVWVEVRVDWTETILLKTCIRAVLESLRYLPVIWNAG